MAKRKRTKSSEKLNIKDHVMVPLHEKCSESEKKQILHKYKADLKDFPKINIQDSALYNLEVKPGDLIKITRNSPTAGESVFYRVVIEV
jgi:DNA-directed RNA polymerase subunit H